MPSETRILRLPEVLTITGLSRSQIYRMVAAGQFPPPVRIGERAVGWREEDVQHWLESRPTAVMPTTRTVRS